MDNLAFAKKRVELIKRHFPTGATVDQFNLLDSIMNNAYEIGYEAAQTNGPEQWSNQSCFGYSILAAERIGMKPDEITRITRSLHRIFDEVSLEEAAEHYRRSPY